jgi:hypothetical protein
VDRDPNGAAREEAQTKMAQRADGGRTPVVEGTRLAILTADDIEQVESSGPRHALRAVQAAGAETPVVAQGRVPQVEGRERADRSASAPVDAEGCHARPGAC